MLGRGAFQDVDLSAVFRDVALSTVTVHAGSDHAELAGTAVKQRPGRTRGRPPGPARRGAGRYRQPRRRCAARPPRRPGGGAVAGDPGRRRGLLRAARRPVIIVGQGARGAAEEVRQLAERLGAPVLTTFRAKGLVPDTHPLGAGVLGRSGTPVASWLMNESDLLLVVGASFANHTGIAPYKPIVQIDDAPSAIGRFDPVAVGVLGDAAVTLRQALVDSRGGEHRGRRPAGDVAVRWAIWRAEKARRAADDRGRGVASAAVFAALSASLPRRRGDRGRRRQPRLLLRPLLRERRPAGAHVRLPRLDRVRLSRPRWVRGRPTRPDRSSRSPVTAASASTSPS